MPKLTRQTRLVAQHAVELRIADLKKQIEEIEKAGLPRDPDLARELVVAQVALEELEGGE
jgi:hypothetical protein